MVAVGSYDFKTVQCVDGTPIGAAPVEALTANSPVECYYLDDFDSSDFESEKY